MKSDKWLLRFMFILSKLYVNDAGEIGFMVLFAVAYLINYLIH